MFRIVNASEVHNGIWVGARPDDGPHLAAERFTLVVTTAGKGLAHWPSLDLAHPAPRRVHHGLSDDAFEIVKGDRERAEAAAQHVADEVRRGGKVLVCCREGLNRSAWVAAWAMVKLGVGTGAECAELVKSRRAGSLYNWFFSEHLKELAK